MVHTSLGVYCPRVHTAHGAYYPWCILRMMRTSHDTDCPWCIPMVQTAVVHRVDTFECHGFMVVNCIKKMMAQEDYALSSFLIRLALHV